MNEHDKEMAIRGIRFFQGRFAEIGFVDEVSMGLWQTVMNETEAAISSIKCGSEV